MIFILFDPRYSRKIMWIDVSTTNNNPNVIMGLYMKAVLEIGGSAAFSASSSDSVLPFASSTTGSRCGLNSSLKATCGFFLLITRASRSNNEKWLSKGIHVSPVHEPAKSYHVHRRWAGPWVGLPLTSRIVYCIMYRVLCIMYCVLCIVYCVLCIMY